MMEQLEKYHNRDRHHTDKNNLTRMKREKDIFFIWEGGFKPEGRKQHFTKKIWASL